jgi:hypothetical protein
MPKSIRRQLEMMGQQLMNADRRSVVSDSSWAANIPAQPGVYALWTAKSGLPIYVGQSSSLRDRMRDLGRSVNHTCRRKIAVRHKLVGASEAKLSAKMAKCYTVSFITVALGRVELEEYLSLLWKKTLLNSPGRRLLTGANYSWLKNS